MQELLDTFSVQDGKIAVGAGVVLAALKFLIQDWFKKQAKIEELREKNAERVEKSIESLREEVSQLRCIYEDHGQLVDDCGCPMYDFIPGEILEARDANGNVLLGSDGAPVLIQHHSRIPKMGSVYKIVRN